MMPNSVRYSEMLGLFCRQAVDEGGPLQERVSGVKHCAHIPQALLYFLGCWCATTCQQRLHAEQLSLCRDSAQA